MYYFNIHGKKYKVRFTYRMICEGDLLDKVTDIGNFDEQSARGILNKLARTTAELLLAGLQKYHKDEFGYDDEEEKNKRIEDMLDLFDDYEDESTEKEPKSAYTLFQDLKIELENNGFLSALMKSAEEAEQMKKIAKQTMTEMENEPVRTKVIDMTPTEKES